MSNNWIDSQIKTSFDFDHVKSFVQNVKSPWGNIMICSDLLGFYLLFTCHKYDLKFSAKYYLVT